MDKRIWIQLQLAGFLLGVLTTGLADSVETRNGAILVGKITEITDDVIKLDTEYAGSLEIQKEKVAGFNTDEPVVVRLASGTTVLGKVTHRGESEIEIDGTNEDLSTVMGEIAASWDHNAEDQKLVKKREASKQKWEYEVAIDITGKEGNSEELGTVLKAKAKRIGVKDTITSYVSQDVDKTRGVTTSNEIKGGLVYNSSFKEKLGWFVRTEMEKDEFEDLSLRATIASGLSSHFYKSDKHYLDWKAGFSYRSERFDDDTKFNTPGLDFNLNHFYQFNNWATVTTSLHFIPSTKDFSDFLLFQDTGLVVPIGGSNFWKLRVGISNSLDNKPLAQNEKLDTHYYMRLLMIWK